MSSPLTRILGVVSLAGSVAAIILAFANGDTWGEPGTAAYQRYEIFNRLMAFALLMMAAGWAGLSIILKRGVGRRGAVTGLIGALLMVVGNTAEFWFFSDLPYFPPNVRHVAWSIFLLGSLILVGGATATGISLRRQRDASPVKEWIMHQVVILLLLLSFPLEIVTFMSLSPFLGSALLALALGWTLFTASDRDMVQSESSTSRSAPA